MDLFKDFFDAVKDRFKSPLVASFIISWLVINWRVPIALFFQSFEDIKQLGYNSYMQYINSAVDTLHGIWYPLLASTFYTFGFPLIRNLNLFSNGWFRTWGYNWYYKIIQTQTVPLTRLLETQQELTNKRKELSELITTEKIILKDKNELKEQFDKLTISHADQQKLINDLKTYTNSYYLTTKKWYLKSQHKYAEKISSIHFTESHIYFNFSPDQEIFQQLDNFFFNYSNKQCFVLKSEKTTRHNHPLINSSSFIIEFVDLVNIKIICEKEEFILSCVIS